MTTKRTHRFPPSILNAIHDSKILGIRAGSEARRFIGVWVVVVKGRVFLRSWNDKPHGWRRVFLSEPRGAIQITGHEIAVRAKHVRTERILDAIDIAYGQKYNTPASLKYVRGLARPRRRKTTTELVRDTTR